MAIALCALALHSLDERIFGDVRAELSHHAVARAHGNVVLLGYERGEESPEGQPNRRNGTSPKTIRTEPGELPVEVPRDREGTFEAQLIPKHERDFSSFDDKILSRRLIR